MVSFKEPQYTKSSKENLNMFRRFLLTEIGDTSVNQANLMREYELEGMEALKT